MMSKINFKNYLLALGAIICMFAAACLKTDDPPPAKPNPNLKNHYCNDPNAINYNWGFPGIPDNSVCIYPVDSFVGQWALTDSVFHSDSTFNYLATRNLSFLSTEDTLHSHLKIMGFCSNNLPLFATADKYGHAAIDSMDSQNAGQFFCTSTDTVTGNFQFLFTTKDTMIVRLNIVGSDAGFHKGIAHKL